MDFALLKRSTEISKMDQQLMGQLKQKTQATTPSNSRRVTFAVAQSIALSV